MAWSNCRFDSVHSSRSINVSRLPFALIASSKFSLSSAGRRCILFDPCLHMVSPDGPSNCADASCDPVQQPGKDPAGISTVARRRGVRKGSAPRQGKLAQRQRSKPLFKRRSCSAHSLFRALGYEANPATSGSMIRYECRGYVPLQCITDHLPQNLLTM